MRHRVGLPLGRGDAQSHADLCLTPLTGVRPEAFGNVWSTVLNEADRVLVARQEEEADGEDKVLHGMLAMMDLACRAAAEDNLTQAATSLVLCGSLAQSLTWRVCRSLRTARRTALHPPTRASEPDTDGRRHSEHNPGSLGKDPVDCAPCEAPDGHPLLKGLPRFHVRGPAEKLFEEAYDWARPMTDAECTLRHLVGIDVNMAFAAGANGLNVGLGEPTRVTNPVFDPKLPGSWLVDLSHVDLSRVKAGKEWVDLDGSLLPSPFTPKGDRPKGPAWYATPTVAYAVELGYDVTPTEAYVRYENGRYLDGWYQRLRDAYLATMAGLGVGADLAPADFLTAMDGYRSRDPELAIVVSAIKATVKGGLGKLRERPRGEGWRPGEPWRALSRPTWRPDHPRGGHRPYRGEGSGERCAHGASGTSPCRRPAAASPARPPGIRSPRLRAGRRRPRRELPRQPASAVTRPRGPRGDCPHRARLTGRGSARRAHDRGARGGCRTHRPGGRLTGQARAWKRPWRMSRKRPGAAPGGG
ncbi:hypothetical protein SMICM17S_03729 [Streptomyces microflavus]